MSLVLQTLGVLVLAAFLADAHGTRRFLPTIPAVAAVGVVLMAFVVATDVFPQIRAQGEQRKANLARTPEDRRSSGGRFGLNREDFHMWVEQRVPRETRLHLFCGPNVEGCAGGYADWITWRQSPRLFTERAEQAQYVLVYNADPKQLAVEGADRWRFIAFEPTFGLLEVPR